MFVRPLTDADENHNVIPEDLTNYKVARAGNLVINKMKAWQPARVKSMSALLEKVKADGRSR